MSAVQLVKYGPVGPHYGVPTRIGFQASQTFHRRGAAFVTIDSAGRAGASVAGDTSLSGWFNVPGFSPGATEVSGSLFTTSSTAGTEYSGYVPGDPSIVYRVPTDAALTETMLGRACDIVVTSTVQYADVGTSTTDVLRIVGDRYLVALGLSEALVQINPSKLTALT